MVPYIVTGSLLAWAGGWNIIIVAEVLHTYIPGGARDLFGIGSAAGRRLGLGPGARIFYDADCVGNFCRGVEFICLAKTFEVCGEV